MLDGVFSPGFVAELDQSLARTREGADMAIELLAKSPESHDSVAQAYWEMLLEATLSPGQLAAIAAELLFRAAREKAQAG